MDYTLKTNLSSLFYKHFIVMVGAMHCDAKLKNMCNIWI